MPGDEGKNTRRPCGCQYGSVAFLEGSTYNLYMRTQKAVDLVPLPPLRFPPVTSYPLPPVTKKKVKVPCTFRLEPDVVEMLEKWRDATGHSQTFLIEHAVRMLDEALLKAEAKKKR
jgi:hypothetical protein